MIPTSEFQSRREQKEDREASLRHATLDFLQKRKNELPAFVSKKSETPPIPNLRAITPTLQLATEFKGSPFHQRVFRELALKFPHYRKIRGDGNCYYRAVLVQYLELLILDDHGPALLLDFLRMLLDLSGCALGSRKELPPSMSLVVGYLYQLYLTRAKDDVVGSLRLFYEMLYWSSQFDKGLIWAVRKMAAQFLRSNKDLEINGLQCEFIFDSRDYSSLEEYVSNNVLEMDTEASDLVLYVLPCVLGIKITTVLIDRSAGNGINLNSYSPLLVSHKKPLSSSQARSLLRKEINLLLKPGHYDGLYSSGLVKDFERRSKPFPPGRCE